MSNALACNRVGLKISTTGVPIHVMRLMVLLVYATTYDLGTLHCILSEIPISWGGISVCLFIGAGHTSAAIIYMWRC
jgi:hypothetical protein